MGENLEQPVVSACMPQELIRISRASANGLPHNPGRSYNPASRGSVCAVEIAGVFLLSASVMNPLSELGNQPKMQVEIQRRQLRLVSLLNARDGAIVDVPQEDLESFDPGFSDFISATSSLPSPRAAE